MFIPSFPASSTLHLTENAADAVPRHGKGLGGDGNKECSAGNADPGTLWLSQCSHHGISRAEMDLIKSCSRKAGSKLCLLEGVIDLQPDLFYGINLIFYLAHWEEQS